MSSYYISYQNVYKDNTLENFEIMGIGKLSTFYTYQNFLNTFWKNKF